MQNTQYNKDCFEFNEHKNQLGPWLVTRQATATHHPANTIQIKTQRQKKLINLSQSHFKVWKYKDPYYRENHKNILELFKHKFASKLSATQKKKNLSWHQQPEA